MKEKQRRTFMGFMHKLEEFVDHCLQEFPMRLEESGVLSDDVHDIRSNDCFVVFSTFHFTKAKQVFDHGDQETLLRVLVCNSGKFRVTNKSKIPTHSPGYRADSPAQRVQVVPRPLQTINLFRQLLSQDGLGIVHI